MASLYSKDGSSRRHVCVGHEVSSGAEVGARSNTLKDLGDSEEGSDVGVGEGVLATSGGNGISGVKRNG